MLIRCRGDYTGEELFIMYSRSPLSDPKHYKKLPVNHLHVGEITQGRIVNNEYSRSPLYEPENVDFLRTLF